MKIFVKHYVKYKNYDTSMNCMLQNDMNSNLPCK